MRCTATTATVPTSCYIVRRSLPGFQKGVASTVERMLADGQGFGVPANSH